MRDLKEVQNPERTIQMNLDDIKNYIDCLHSASNELSYLRTELIGSVKYPEPCDGVKTDRLYSSSLFDQTEQIKDALSNLEIIIRGDITAIQQKIRSNE